MIVSNMLLCFKSPVKEMDTQYECPAPQTSSAAVTTHNNYS